MGSTKKARSGVVKKAKHRARVHEVCGGGFLGCRSCVRVCIWDTEWVLGSRPRVVGFVGLGAAEARVPVEPVGLGVEPVDPAGQRSRVRSCGL